jgi:hypothetical protein
LYDTGAVGDPTKQRHDWEPGIARSGLFWTIPISPSAIKFDTDTGDARFHARHLRVNDFHDFFNAVQGGGPQPVPSRVSFDVRWHGHGKSSKVRDKTFGFEGQYVAGKTTISFSAAQDGGVVYRSDHAGQYNPTLKQGGAGHPAVGIERNGVFFR